MSISGTVAYRGNAPKAAIAVNIPVCLAFGSLTGLALAPLFGSLSALIFLAFGALLIASNIMRSLSVLARWWLILLLPAYCVLSVLWSDFPALTLRHSIQLSLTVVIAVVIAERVSSPHLRNIVFITYGIGVLLSLLFGRSVSHSGALLGIFASKNAFATYLALFIVIAASFVLDPRSRPWVRMIALVIGLLCFPMLLRAQSAGTLLTTLPCLAVMALVISSQYLSGPQKLFLVLFAVLSAIGIGVVLILYSDAVLALILESTGKDVTLTGRTVLWEIAASLIAENPWLGVGYRSFWVIGYGPAEELWRMFHVHSGAGFSFHNTYISNAVDLGILGVALQIILIYTALGALVWLAIVRPTPEVALWLGIHLLVVLRSFIETEVFFEFSMSSILAIYTLIFAWHRLRAWKAENMQSRQIAPPPPLLAGRKNRSVQGRAEHRATREPRVQ